MMRRFCLAALDGPISLPDCVTADGVDYPVHTDFRRILLVIRMLGDPVVRDADKPALMRQLFYIDRSPDDPFEPFDAFARCGESPGEAGGVKDFDYEFDSREIYAAFMQEYGIDLIDIPYLHWYKFSALLSSAFCGDNALSSKVRLRHADDSEAVRKSGAERAKRNAALPLRVTQSDEDIERALVDRLKAGKPVGDLLRR